MAVLRRSGDSSMNAFRSATRPWFWIAVAAIAIAVLALLIPHGQTTDAPAWMALLPCVLRGTCWYR